MMSIDAANLRVPVNEIPSKILSNHLRDASTAEVLLGAVSKENTSGSDPGETSETRAEEAVDVRRLTL